jgi:CDGSH-type Zn-finger protein
LNRFFGQLASKPFSNGTRTKVRFDGTEAASRKTFLNIARRTTRRRPENELKQH